MTQNDIKASLFVLDDLINKLDNALTPELINGTRELLNLNILDNSLQYLANDVRYWKSIIKDAISMEQKLEDDIK